MAAAAAAAVAGGEWHCESGISFHIAEPDGNNP
jgi:hypothetical protein